MKILAFIAVLVVALLHFGFLMLEMFYWDHEVGRSVICHDAGIFGADRRPRRQSGAL